MKMDQDHDNFNMGYGLAQAIIIIPDSSRRLLQFWHSGLDDAGQHSHTGMRSGGVDRHSHCGVDGPEGN